MIIQQDYSQDAQTTALTFNPQLSGVELIAWKTGKTGNMTDSGIQYGPYPNCIKAGPTDLRTRIGWISKDSISEMFSPKLRTPLHAAVSLMSTHIPLDSVQRLSLVWWSVFMATRIVLQLRGECLSLGTHITSIGYKWWLQTASVVSLSDCKSQRKPWLNLTGSGSLVYNKIPNPVITVNVATKSTCNMMDALLTFAAWQVSY